MPLHNLDRWITELHEEHERYRKVLSSLQGSAHMEMAEDVRASLQDVMRGHQGYMQALEHMATQLEGLKQMPEPTLDDAMIAPLVAGHEKALAGLKPSGESKPRHDQPSPPESSSPKEPAAPESTSTLESGSRPRGGR